LKDKIYTANRVFSQNVMHDLLRNGSNEIYSSVVKQYVKNPEKKRNSQIFKEMYRHLGTEYRNEYFYQNTLLNHLLVNAHNADTTTVLSQLRIDKSIADFVMINGEARVYEIKSDLDSFSRLESQLKDYFKAFSKVSVLISASARDKVTKLISGFSDFGVCVGIYSMNAQGLIIESEIVKEPVEYHKLLDHTCIFHLLRKYEYENVLRTYFGFVPESDPVFHLRMCLAKFKEIPISDAQRLTYCELKKRRKISSKEFNSIQKEIKSVVYFSELIHKVPEVNEFLKAYYGR